MRSEGIALSSQICHSTGQPEGDVKDDKTIRKERLLNGSGVSREAPAPFCEGPEGKFLWSTHHQESE